MTFIAICAVVCSDDLFVLFSSGGDGGAKTVFVDPSYSLALMAEYVLGEEDSCGPWGSFSPRPNLLTRDQELVQGNLALGKIEAHVPP